MKSKSNIRIVDIARMAEVSIGTVDRVLHNRGHVSEEKRERVEKVLKEINYEPNMVARFLASKRTYTFAAIVPFYTKGSYWELACEGINRASAEMRKFNINVEYFHFDQYDRNSFQESAKALLNSKFDGVVIATLFEGPVITLSKQLDEMEIPYIYIDSDIPGQNHLAYFGGNSFVSGTIAAKLLTGAIGQDSDIFFTHVKFKHTEVSVQMKTREMGFMDYLNTIKYKGTIHHIEIDPDDHTQSLNQLTALLEKNQNLIGGIVFNSRIYELINLLNKINNKLKTNIMLIGHDAIEGNVDALKNGQIMFLLSQRPDLQGYDAVKALGNYFLFKQTPNKENYMPIDILLKENVDYYNNYKL
ncbi:substrate-binding domain-containing protein [Dysgonomonas sp. 520]|uniref:LacI family DNA-binding transcriptional regulator n=1 Tax=Dysgonomonas sp. 520 TaxID=2302931 RepID=UPI0013CF525D|nr:substrate-binding domain-containing protein [Dysgonomonas sp. 520]NDW10092.1 LacI family DNA-binding transcriptional regulator [Dysgonomonas sp. 520]